jgi:hypothetical protein
LSWNDKKKEEYKDLIKNEKIKEIIKKINKEIEQLQKDFCILVSLITEAQKKGESKIPPGFISFNFVDPIPKMSGLENFLLNRILNKESYHKIEYVLNKNKSDEIIQLFLKGFLMRVNGLTRS